MPRVHHQYFLFSIYSVALKMVLTTTIASKLMMMIYTHNHSRNWIRYWPGSCNRNLNLFTTCVRIHNHCTHCGQSSYICLDACVSPSKEVQDRPWQSRVQLKNKTSPSVSRRGTAAASIARGMMMERIKKMGTSNNGLLKTSGVERRRETFGVWDNHGWVRRTC